MPLRSRLAALFPRRSIRSKANTAFEPIVTAPDGLWQPSSQPTDNDRIAPAPTILTKSEDVTSVVTPSSPPLGSQPNSSNRAPNIQLNNQSIINSPFTAHTITVNQIIGRSNVLAPANGDGVQYKSMPSSSPHFVGREDQQNAMKEFFKRRESPEPRRTFAVQGIGGAGKTQLSLKFIEKNQDLFSAIYWIDATSADTIKASFIAIASSVVARSAGAESSLESVMQWLGSSKEELLLIFDGADLDADTISNYLPPMNRGNVLISTRNEHMRSIATGWLDLLDMTQSDAETLLLLSAKLDPTLSYNRDLAAPIVRELCCMALAVDQAGSSIASGIAPLSEYHGMYLRHRTRLSDDKHFKGQSKYGRPLYTTWDISLEAIKGRGADASAPEHRDYIIALFVMQMLSFLHYEGISEEMFNRTAIAKKANSSEAMNDILKVDEHGQWDPIAFRSGIRVLRSFSFIKPGVAPSVYTMHRLVHGWVRARMTMEEQTIAIKATKTIFYQSLPIDLDSHIPYCRLIVPHIISHLDTVTEEFSGWQDDDVRKLFVIGHVLRYMGYPQKALSCLSKCVVWCRKLGRENPATLYSMHYLAATYCDLGDHRRAEELQVKVLEAHERLFGLMHQATLKSLNNLATTYCNLGDYRRSQGLLVKVLEAGERLLGPEHPDTLMSTDNLALTYRYLGDYKKAEELQLKVLEAHERLLGPEHPHTLTSMNNLASTYSDLGYYRRAEELQVKVLETCKQLLGPEHPYTLTIMNNLASSYSHLGNHKRTEELQLKVLDARERILGSDHPDTLWSLNDLALAYTALGDCRRAEELQVKVLETRERLLGPEHPDTLKSLNNLALTYSHLENYKRAEELQLMVLEARERILGPEHPDTLRSMYNLGRIYISLRQYAEANNLCSKLVAILGPDHRYSRRITRRLNRVS